MFWRRRGGWSAAPLKEKGKNANLSFLAPTMEEFWEPFASTL